MEKYVELLKAVLQTYFRGCFEIEKAFVEQFVASGGNHFGGHKILIL
jgi:hypothetical protein